MTAAEKAVIDGLRSGLRLHQVKYSRNWALFRQSDWEHKKPVRTFNRLLILRMLEAKLLQVRCHEGEYMTRVGLPVEGA